jgi:uroporphyrinogen-III decarboxylase
MTDIAHDTLISYIAPAAPATRRSARGDEPFLRPEIGFTPNWYRHNVELDGDPIDFGERWHTDPTYRRQTIVAARDVLRSRFPGTSIGHIDEPDAPLDLLTGTYGGSLVSAIFGVPIIWASDNWPNAAHEYLSDDEMASIEPPDLDTNPVFQVLMRQVDWIAQSEGVVQGFINPQGIINNAQRLRGENIFLDMMDNPDACRHLFDVVATTMIDLVTRLHNRQRETGFDPQFVTVSNCLVNMVSPNQYHELLLPYDVRIAEAFPRIGIHNCAWNANPYMDDYATVPNLSYIDMGLMSDMERARDLVPQGRRALMYTPMDVANKDSAELRSDFERIAAEYGPCDIVLADIEAGTPDERVQELVDMCREISARQE